MTQSLLAGAFLAALLYVLIPGPAFLALRRIRAGQGEKSGAQFVCGHPLIGDTLWASLALVAIIGAKLIMALRVRRAGALSAGFYLAWIGWIAFRAPNVEGRRRSR